MSLDRGRILNEVALEREAQDAKWGIQNHPDGTDNSEMNRKNRDAARRQTDAMAAAGYVTWRDILEEEVAEAIAEDDPALLRAELIQVAAVAAQWAEAIDRRTS